MLRFSSRQPLEIGDDDPEVCGDVHNVNSTTITEIAEQVHYASISEMSMFSGRKWLSRTFRCFAPVAAGLLPLVLLGPMAGAAQDIPADAKWITALGAPEHSPQVVLFRRVISLDTVPASYPVHVSADNRLQLYVNGRRVGEGPARGDRTHWRYETFDLRPFLQRGENVIAARVWNFGDQSSTVQLSVRTGFLLWGDTPVRCAANTNESWSARSEHGWSASFQGFPASPGERVDAKGLDPAWNAVPITGDWSPAVPIANPVVAKGTDEATLDYVWHLVPDTLPPMEYTPIGAGHVMRAVGVNAEGFPGRPIQVAARTHASILLDRDTLTTAYPELIVGAGKDAKIRLLLALLETPAISLELSR